MKKYLYINASVLEVFLGQLFKKLPVVASLSDLPLDLLLSHALLLSVMLWFFGSW